MFISKKGHVYFYKLPKLEESVETQGYTFAISSIKIHEENDFYYFGDCSNQITMAKLLAFVKIVEKRNCKNLSKLYFYSAKK
jgi:hypothetical protein